MPETNGSPNRLAARPPPLPGPWGTPPAAAGAGGWRRPPRFGAAGGVRAQRLAAVGAKIKWRAFVAALWCLLSKMPETNCSSNRLAARPPPCRALGAPIPPLGSGAPPPIWCRDPPPQFRVLVFWPHDNVFLTMRSGLFGISCATRECGLNEPRPVTVPRFQFPVRRRRSGACFIPLVHLLGGVLGPPLPF